MRWHNEWMVVSDLDGTLLDHDSYSWRPAAAEVARLINHGVPLVLASSKTLAEMRGLAAEMGLHDPMIAENGAVLAWPGESGCRVEITGRPRDEIVARARRLRAAHGYRFEGFADWSVEQLAADCGLDAAAAALALDRHGTEPIVWQDSTSAYEAFVAALAEQGIRAVRGGRYIHLMGEYDKADGMRRVVEAIGRERERDMKVIALGDSPNDAAMLSAADVAVRIRSAKSTDFELDAACLTEPELPGPAGWADAIRHWWDAQGKLSQN